MTLIPITNPADLASASPQDTYLVACQIIRRGAIWPATWHLAFWDARSRVFRATHDAREILSHISLIYQLPDAEKHLANFIPKTPNPLSSPGQPAKTPSSPPRSTAKPSPQQPHQPGKRR